MKGYIDSEYEGESEEYNWALNKANWIKNSANQPDSILTDGDKEKLFRLIIGNLS